MYSSIFIQENMWYYKFNESGPYSGVVMTFKQNVFRCLGTRIIREQYILGGEH